VIPGGDVVPGGGDPGRRVHPQQVANLGALGQGDDLAGGAGPGRATGAVPVVLVILGRVELDD
jgi:hypothetical protein